MVATARSIARATGRNSLGKQETGIALAFVCAAKGYDLVLTLPQGMSRERESLLRLYGARVDITESLGGMNEAVEAARAMARDEDVFDQIGVTEQRHPQRADGHTHHITLLLADATQEPEGVSKIFEQIAYDRKPRRDRRERGNIHGASVAVSRRAATSHTRAV